MANRRFEMFEIRHILVRMRQGDSDRAIAKAGLISRPKAPLCQDSCRIHIREIEE
jgi:hypothetical protein